MNVALDASVIEGFVLNFLIDTYDERAEIPDCHRKWWELATSKKRRVAFAAPRGHAKSTAINHAYGLAASLFKQHPFQIKVSRTYQLACEKLDQAKQELIDNEKIKRIFRLKRFVRERENDFIAEMSDGYQFRMFALGMGQATRGLSWGTMRPTLIQGDDMEDDEEVLNLERREKGWRWVFNTLLPMGGDKTDIRIYGTILHHDSILARLIKSKSWHGGLWQACDADLAEDSILWPEKFTKGRLEQIRNEYIDAGNLIGFNMEYRNIAQDDVGGFIRKSDFLGMDEADHKKKKTFYVGGDFAISKEKRRDFTCFEIGGLDNDNYLNMVDERRGRWGSDEIIATMLDIEEMYQPEAWFVEKGQIYLAIVAALERAQVERGVFLNLVPMTPIKDKRTRGTPFQKRMRAKGVRWDTTADYYKEQEEELVQFRGGDERNDRFDSCAWLVFGIEKRGVEPITEDEEEEFEFRRAKREASPEGRSPFTGY